MGYSIRAKKYLEDVKVELRTPSSRSIEVQDSKDLFIHYQKSK
jgi:hypothetical protein